MKVLITGAAGNLGSNLARHLLGSPLELRLVIHRKEMPFDTTPYSNVSVCRADLGEPRTLTEVCAGADCVVHFAGVLFAPGPEKFLWQTNVDYVRNLVAAALAAGVRKIILISFPHVEGETSPDHPATDRLDGAPGSVHARTRLAAEQHLFEACRGKPTTAVSLRAGMIYGRGILMVDAARWLLARRLLAVWKQPTWIHLLAPPDFLNCVTAAIQGGRVSGIYNLGDDQPMTLQEFLDTAAAHWQCGKSWRLPQWTFHVASACCETFAAVVGTASPLTRDFIKIGMASYVADTTRMKRDLAPKLVYPSLKEGLVLL